MEAKDKIKLLAGHLDEVDITMINNAIEEAKQGGIREVVGIVQEMVRLLGKVVPEDQNKMIEWAVKSQDSVYTNAGAAFRVGIAALEKLGLSWERPSGYRTD